jgi:hypothetical protein
MKLAQLPRRAGTFLFLTAASLWAQAPAAYAPLSPSGRAAWMAKSTVGYQTLSGGLFSAGFGTWRNRPPEYGTQWEGFGKRYGMRLTGTATSNAMEAGLGALWGEDPRYFRAGADRKFGGRVGHAVRSAFLARDRNGNTMPAYARYGAIAGSNFLSNTWRVSSESSAQDAVSRIGLGFLGRVIGNAVEEFWPDVKKKLRGR